MNILNFIKNYKDKIFNSFNLKYKNFLFYIKLSDEDDKLIKDINLYIRTIEEKNIKTINVGWNSTNSHIKTPNNNIVEDVGDLATFNGHILKFNNGRLYTKFLDNSQSDINFRSYFLNKNNEIVDMEIYVKKFISYTKIILSTYEKELKYIEVDNSYKRMILSAVLNNIKITLQSLASMK